MFEQSYLFLSVGHCGPLYNRSNDSLRTDSGNESSKHVWFFFPSARDVCIADKTVLNVSALHRKGWRNIS